MVAWLEERRGDINYQTRFGELAFPNNPTSVACLCAPKADNFSYTGLIRSIMFTHNQTQGVFVGGLAPSLYQWNDITGEDKHSLIFLGSNSGYVLNDV